MRKIITNIKEESEIYLTMAGAMVLILVACPVFVMLYNFGLSR